MCPLNPQKKVKIKLEPYGESRGASSCPLIWQHVCVCALTLSAEATLEEANSTSSLSGVTSTFSASSAAACPQAGNKGHQGNRRRRCVFIVLCLMVHPEVRGFAGGVERLLWMEEFVLLMSWQPVMLIWLRMNLFWGLSWRKSLVTNRLWRVTLQLLPGEPAGTSRSDWQTQEEKEEKEEPAWARRKTTHFEGT